MIPTGWQIREGRELIGMSQADLAAAAGVGLAVVIRAELAAHADAREEGLRSYPSNAGSCRGRVRSRGWRSRRAVAEGRVVTLTAAQVRQACALLGWKSPRLSRRARISYKAALNAQRDEGILTVSDADLLAISTALEEAGVHFEPDDDSRPIAVLSKVEP